MTWKEFAEQHNLSYNTVKTHLHRGYCHYPRQSNQNAHHKNIAYGCWAAMWVRCTNPNHDKYHLYGGRGIKIDPRWKSFDVFISYMGPRPDKRHSLDRIDPNANYEPGNVRWATQQKQALNTTKAQASDMYYGITKHGKKFQISRGRKVYRFNTKEEALSFKRQVDNNN